MDDTTNREHFSGTLFGLFHLICFLSIIPSPEGRPALKGITFFVLSWISYYLITKTTTQDLFADLSLGTAILIQLMIVFDMMFITHPDTLRDFQDSHSGKITERPFKERALWAYNFYTNPRGIGWAHESPHIPNRPSPSTPRWRFVGTRVIRALLYLVLEWIAHVLNSSNPGLTTSSVPFYRSALQWRALAALGIGVVTYARLNLMHCLLSASVVACGFSAPERWPNLFGSPLLAWNVQQFWRKVWHTILRKSAISYATFTTSKIFRFQTRTHGRQANISNFVQNSLFLCTAFTVTGFVHIGGDYMLLGRMSSTAFKFFFLQSVGMILEKIVISGWAYFNPPLGSDARTKLQNGCNVVKGVSANASKKDEQSRNGPEAMSEPPIWIRCVGYAWVILWFFWSFSFVIDPMVSSGMFTDDLWMFIRSLL